MKFQPGDKVRKISGGKWRGTVVGTYSTELTPEGYAVESSAETGSVQIYPAKALESWDGEAEGYTAADMATARAEGFRDGQTAAQLAPAQDEQSAVFWVLFDATGPERFIKKDVNDGTLAFFDSEYEAQRAKRRHTGTDYKRVEYYRAPIAQTEQQPEQSETVLVPVSVIEEAAHMLEAHSPGSGSVESFAAQDLRAALSAQGGQ